MAAEEVLFLRRWPGRRQPAAPARACRVDLAVYDSLLGRTYSEIGTEARSMHKCQGQAQLLALPGPSAGTFQLAASTIPGQMDRDERSLFDGVDTSIAGLAKFAGARPPRDLVDGLAVIAASVQTAQRKFDTESDGATRARRCSRACTPCACCAVELRDDGHRRRPRGTRSSSACARKSASSSRRSSPPTACASKRWPTTAWSFPDSR